MATTESTAGYQTSSCAPRSKSTFTIFLSGLVIGLLLGLFGGAVLLPVLETRFGYGAAPVTIETVRSRRAATQAEQAERARQLAPAPADSPPPAPAAGTTPDNQKPAPASPETPK